MMVQSRNKFRLVRFLIFHFSSFLKIFPRTAERKILIIKLDAIGDYILFRNFIEEIRKEPKYQGYSIDLLGNESWKDIALTYDNSFISNFIFSNPFELEFQPLKFLKTGWSLYRNKYKMVLHPTYSRTLIQDGLAGFTCAEEIVGYQSDNELQPQKYKKRTDRFYTSQVIVPADIVFEFYRTKFFFETLTGRTVTLPKPMLPVNETREDYVVIFPGSMDTKKEWGLKNFLFLIRKILENTNSSIVLAGGKSELRHSEYLISNLPAERVSSLIGKTTLPGLIDLIQRAACVITNDTSAVHIAAATNTPFVCIHGVAHYKRFIPYPEGMLENAIFVHEHVPCFNCNWRCIFTTSVDEPYPCISMNTVDAVWRGFSKITCS